MISPTPALEIGDESGPAYQFNVVAGAARLSDGRVVVLDAGSNELRMFDANGRHVRTAAKQGQGPGEIQSAYALFILPGDTIVVDDARRAHSYFAPDGSYLRRVPIPPPPGAPALRTVGFFDDGSVLADYIEQRQNDPGTTKVDSAVALRLTASGSPTGTLGRFPATSAETFGPVGWIAPAGDHYYSAWSATPDILVHSMDGLLRQIIRKPWSTSSVTPDDIERFKRRDRQTRRTPTGKPLSPEENARRDAALAARRFADAFALYATGWADREGNLWVRHYEMRNTLRDDPDAPSTRPNHYSVFDPSGRWLGDMEVPVNLQLLDVTDTYVVGVTRTEDGVEHIRVHDLLKPASGTAGALPP